MTSVTLARPANIPYEALYIDGERIADSGFGRQLDIDDVLIHLAFLVEGGAHLRIITTPEAAFDAESGQLPMEESDFQIERIDYEVESDKVGVA